MIIKRGGYDAALNPTSDRGPIDVCHRTKTPIPNNMLKKKKSFKISLVRSKPVDVLSINSEPSPLGVDMKPEKCPLKVFLSHNWGKDDEGRENHSRVRKLNEGLLSKGLKTW